MAKTIETFYQRRRRASEVLQHLGVLDKRIERFVEGLEDVLEDITVPTEEDTSMPGGFRSRPGDDPTEPFTEAIAKAGEQLIQGRDALDELRELARAVRKTPPPSGAHLPEEWPR